SLYFMLLLHPTPTLFPYTTLFRSWARMPELGEQLSISEAYTSDFLVSRALLRRGRKYEDAVKIFSPYTEIQDPYPEARSAVRELDRKSTRLNSSHLGISYAVFCLK